MRSLRIMEYYAKQFLRILTFIALKNCNSFVSHSLSFPASKEQKDIETRLIVLFSDYFNKEHFVATLHRISFVKNVSMTANSRNCFLFNFSIKQERHDFPLHTHNTNP